MKDVVYTIGHSTHSMDKLIELLARHEITAVADVRSRPYSRFNPQFNRELISLALKKAGVAYVFLGQELGARSEDQRCYVDGKVQYDLLAQTELFQSGMQRVIEGISKYRLALMCAEKDPLVCHRAILVCRHLVARRVHVEHIREDGRLESHADALVRLLRENGSQGPELFRSRDEMVEEAYSLRGEKIAYSAASPNEEEEMRGMGR